MKKYKIFHPLSVLLIVVMCMCGCQEAKVEESKEELSKNAEEENPFDLETLKESGQSIQASFSFGVHNYNEDKSQIPYDGGELQVDFEVTPDDCSFECSVLIYVDGVLQPYAMEPQGDVSEQHTVKVENQMTIISTYFTPKIDGSIKKHRMHFLCMYDPEYEPGEGNISYGNSHKVSQVMPWELVINGKAENSEDAVIEEKPEKIPEEKIAEQEETGRDLDGTILYETENGAEEGEVTFRVLGGVSGTYRLSAYVGHKLVEFSNGARYIDCSFDGSHMYEGSINTGKFAGEDYDTLYFVAIPISDFETAMVVKSSSVRLYHGGILDVSDE